MKGRGILQLKPPFEVSRPSPAVNKKIDEAYDFYRMKKYEIALAKFQAIQPRHIDVIIGIARCYKSLGYPQKAISLLLPYKQMVVSESREERMLIVALATCYLADNQIAKAKAIFSTLSPKFNNYAAVKFVQVLICEAEQSKDAAYVLFEKLEQTTNRSHVPTFIHHAAALMQEDRDYKGALKVLSVFTDAKKLKTQFPTLQKQKLLLTIIYCLLASCYLELGELHSPDSKKLAQKYAGLATETTPTYAPAWSVLAKVVGGKAGAEYYDKAMHLDPVRFKKLHGEPEKMVTSIILNDAKEVNDELEYGDGNESVQHEEFKQDTTLRDSWDDERKECASKESIPENWEDLCPDKTPRSFVSVSNHFAALSVEEPDDDKEEFAAQLAELCSVVQIMKKLVVVPVALDPLPEPPLTLTPSVPLSSTPLVHESKQIDDAVRPSLSQKPSVKADFTKADDWFVESIDDPIERSPSLITRSKCERFLLAARGLFAPMYGHTAKPDHVEKIKPDLHALKTSNVSFS